MREFEPVECPKCKRHVDPEEYDEVDETCDACRRDRELTRYLNGYSEMDPLDQPWGGSGMDDSAEHQPGGNDHEL